MLIEKEGFASSEAFLQQHVADGFTPLLVF
jgi:hypothetical protein